MGGQVSHCNNSSQKKAASAGCVCFGERTPPCGSGLFLAKIIISSSPMPTPSMPTGWLVVVRGSESPQNVYCKMMYRFGNQVWRGI
ncbi:MAG: hypothetical protein EOM40_04380 [Clostridia bacterium]|nr:hypothetical protein [Clostridia bacterium]NCC42027.1 hypothetical protein [Clostridia bacterium]